MGQAYFGRAGKNPCKTMELFQTKAKNGFGNLEVGGYLAYTPWETLLSALGGRGVDGPVFLCDQQNIGRRAARHARAVQTTPHTAVSDSNLWFIRGDGWMRRKPRTCYAV